jgi:hypothetical protein
MKCRCVALSVLYAEGALRSRRLRTAVALPPAEAACAGERGVGVLVPLLLWDFVPVSCSTVGQRQRSKK